MNNDIKVGDLVCIIRACCPKSEALIGMIFRVIDIRSSADSNNGQCKKCGKHGPSPLYAVCSPNRPRSGYGLWRLKKIPPLSELEETDHKEEITA